MVKKGKIASRKWEVKTESRSVRFGERMGEAVNSRSRGGQERKLSE